MSLIQGGANDSFALLTSGQAFAVANEAIREDTVGNSKQDKIGTAAGGKIKYVKWGEKNQKPQEMLQLAASNHFKPQLLYTERNLNLGTGLLLYKRLVTDKKKISIEPVVHAGIEDFLEELAIWDFLRRGFYNLAYFGNVFPFGRMDSSGDKKLAELSILDCTEVRAGLIEKDKRVPSVYYHHPTWKNPKADEILSIDVWNPDEKLAFDQAKFILHLKDGIPGQTYYDFAAWWGSEIWTEIDNFFARAVRSGLINGWNVKYLVRYPKDFFLKQYEDEEKAKKAEADFLDGLDKFLAGVDNVNKTLVIKFAQDLTGKEIPGFSIEPVNNPNGGLNSELAKAAAIAQTSAHGLDPSLAAVDTGGKFGSSGSEKRISYQLHLAMRTPVPRKIMLDAVNRLVKAYYPGQWPEGVRIGIEDVDILTLAENPKGQEKVANPQL